MTPDELQQLLAVAASNHASASNPLDTAYWQGRKDALRALLAEALNDSRYLEQSASSVFAVEQARRAFQPVDREQLTRPTQCVECGGEYFHAAGCLHGAGLAPEEFLRRTPDFAYRLAEARLGHRPTPQILWEQVRREFAVILDSIDSDNAYTSGAEWWLEMRAVRRLLDTEMD